ncbi:ABC transporter permease [Promethearchaeum syntrophicum]|uniref:ABC transporter permease n=1 Tax=Promethearchaeum syntrophicum TaxID=2594042 RepID=A0A5B9D618_9ARCH|nr:ABC transporter permease [Candidatus Prometheoarchaeum syntrophicum]QEE14433.1 ABC-2 family transporter protein [Candidatus Prometheoarchaeum syntrophicum]
MAEIEIKTQSGLYNLPITEERTKTGTKRSILQIRKTITFEFARNGRRAITSLFISFAIFALFLIVQIIQENQGSPVPEDPAEYFQGYLFMIDFLILIIAATFGGSIIAEDFEKQTGNLLFPKITKDRLLVGRIIARYIYSMAAVIFYYILVAITTFIKYDGIPKIIWGSLGWALLYTFALLSFVTMFSALMKRSSTAMISSILIVLIVFQLLTMILMYTGATVEPFFMLTYYANIIRSWFNMPADDQRFTEFSFRGGPSGQMTDGNTYMSWSTPSATGAVIGMLVYSAICLTIAYLVFRRRQNK